MQRAAATITEKGMLVVDYNILFLKNRAQRTNELAF